LLLGQELVVLVGHRDRQYPSHAQWLPVDLPFRHLQHLLCLQQDLAVVMALRWPGRYSHRRQPSRYEHEVQDFQWGVVAVGCCEGCEEDVGVEVLLYEVERLQ